MQKQRPDVGDKVVCGKTTVDRRRTAGNLLNASNHLLNNLTIFSSLHLISNYVTKKPLVEECKLPFWCSSSKERDTETTTN